MKRNKKETQTKAVLCILVLLFTTTLTLLPRGESKHIDDLVVDFHFSAPQVEETLIDNIMYHTITMTDTQPSGSAGEPCLPTRGISLLLPQGRTVKDITITKSQKQHVGFGYLIQPVGEPVPLSDSTSARLPIPQKELYSSHSVFPSAIFETVGIHSYRGYQILLLNIHPVQYIPASGEVSYFTDLTIVVHLQPSDAADILYRGRENDKKDVLGMIENPAVLSTYVTGKTSRSPPVYDMLIITTEDLKNGFIPLTYAHIAQGIITGIVTLDYICNTYPGIDVPEKIRNYLIEKYNTWGIEYVLIGGDNDTVPARLLWVDPLVEGISADTMPSDGYYACLNGQYNSDGDDFWGEPTDGENGDDVDLIADVYVGRAPVGTLSEVNNFVNKTIQYMNYQDNESYLEKMQFVGERLGFGGPSQYGGNHMDELIDGSSNHAYVTMGVPSAYYTIDTLYDRDWMPLPMWPKQELINRINNNTHLLNHLGHADWNKNLKINLTDVMNLTNEHPCFIYSQGCRAGSFDNVFGNDDCIAEYFTVKTPHAAFAGIWNVRYGWGKADSTDGASQRYHREFIDAFFGEGIRSLGLANHDSKHDNLYRINEQCMRYVNYGLNLFGDPAVDLHITALTGENIVIRHDGNIIYNTGSFNIGSLQQNQKSKIITFTIENSGVQPLEFTGVPSIQLQGSCAQDFFVNQFPAVSQLQPGESTVFSVQFAPTKSGRRTADIVIPNNDPYANPYTFSLYGRLWSEAYNQQSGIWYHTIQEAIDDAELNNVILVPEGEYYIESSITLSKAITLRSMNGAGKTILNGVTHHQRCVILDSSGAALKGFTVMNGYAVGNDVGGGIMIASGGSIDSCIVLHNYAEQGGGIYVESNGRITNCDITENVARTNGGGIMLASGGVIERCTIHSNLALNGGGLYSANNGRITHSCLEDNIAYSEGGGLYALSSLAVSNSLLAANTAYWSGGIYLGGSQQGTTQSFDLCTIATNFAENGINDPMFPVCGGIYAVDSASYIRISNSIVADNKRNDIGGTDDVVISNYIGSLHFEYTCTTPLPSSGFGNINDDPLFVFLGSLHPYSLQAGSPCINAGNPNDIPLPLRDLAGKPRLVNGRVDMGCYEFQLSTPPGGSSVEVDPEIN